MTVTSNSTTAQCSVSVTTPPAPGGGNNGNGGNHPYLLFTDQDLVGIRAKVNDTSTINNKYWVAMYADCTAAESSVLNNVFPGSGFSGSYDQRDMFVDAEKVRNVAICAAIANDASMMSAVKTALSRLKNYPFSVFLPDPDNNGSLGDIEDIGVFGFVIVAMDIAHDAFLETNASDMAARNYVQDLIYRFAELVLDDPHWGNTTNTSVHRGNKYTHATAAVYGAGTYLKDYTRYGSGRTPAQLRTTGEQMMKNFLEASLDKDGSVYEAYNYVQSVNIPNMYLWVQVLKNYAGTNLFQYRVIDGKPILQKFGEYAMHISAPDLEHTAGFGDGRDTLGSHIPYIMNAANYNDGVAMWYWNEMDRRGVRTMTTTNIRNDYEEDDLIFASLWGKRITEVPPSSAPAGVLELFKAYDAPFYGPDRGDYGSGHAMMRTGFANANDIQLMTKAGEAGAFHGHSDQGGYILNAFGKRFLTDVFKFTGGYESYGYKYLQSSRAHSGVMACTTDLTTCEASGYQHYSEPTLNGFNKIASITQAVSSGDMHRMAMDLTTAYQRNPKNTSITDAKRHIVFVRKNSSDGYYVVIDDLSSSVARRWQQRQHYSEDVTPSLPGGSKVTLSSIETPANKVFINTVYSNEAMTMRGPSDETDGSYMLDHFVELTTNNASNRFVQVTLLYPSATGVAPVVSSPIVSGNVVTVTVDGRTVTYDQSTKTVTMSGGGTPPAVCNDGLDNDSDGKIDYGTAASNDPGCTSATDTDEYNTPPAQCADGLDNDSDGKTDFGTGTSNDPGCTSNTDNDEFNLPPTSPVTCSPTSQSAYTGVSASFTAANGNGTYAWTATGGSPATGSGASFSTTYSSTGTKSVAVTSNSTSASCSVSVTTPPVSTTACSDDVDGTDSEDTLIDMADPGCAISSDTDESNPTPSTRFTIGNNVVVSNTGGTNVREYPAGPTVTDTGQAYLATGRVVGGPKYAALSGAAAIWWWQFDFTNAPDGWAGEGSLTRTTVSTACANGADDDSDGLIDLADPGCTSAEDTDEYNITLPVCSDGRDNDSDGLVDMADYGCAIGTDTDESNPTVSTKFSIGTNITVSGIEGVNVREYPAGPTVTGVAQPTDATGRVIAGPKYAVLNGTGYWWWQIDYVSAPDGWSGETLLSAVPEVPAIACANSRDDDGDGRTDMQDPGCVTATDIDESNPTPVSTKFAVGNTVSVTTTTFLNVRKVKLEP